MGVGIPASCDFWTFNSTYLSILAYRAYSMLLLVSVCVCVSCFVGQFLYTLLPIWGPQFGNHSNSVPRWKKIANRLFVRRDKERGIFLEFLEWKFFWRQSRTFESPFQSRTPYLQLIEPGVFSYLCLCLLSCSLPEQAETEPSLLLALQSPSSPPWMVLLVAAGSRQNSSVDSLHHALGVCLIVPIKWTLWIHTGSLEACKQGELVSSL